MSPATQAQTTAIFEALARGSSAALEALYDAYAEPIYHLLRSRGVGREDAEDILQESFLGMAERGPKTAQIEDVRAYLFAIARNKLAALERRRATARNTPMPPDLVDGDALNPSARAEALRVQEALGELPSEQREVVVLKVWDELTFAEIAEALDIPQNTAASRYRYAREKLRELLGEDDHG